MLVTATASSGRDCNKAHAFHVRERTYWGVGDLGSGHRGGETCKHCRDGALSTLHQTGCSSATASFGTLQ